MYSWYSHCRTSTVSTCKKHKVAISHAARQVQISDFTTFTHILAADANNLRDLERIKPAGCKAEVRLWASYADGEPIPDPYYGGVVRTSFVLCIAVTDNITEVWVRELLSDMHKALERLLGCRPREVMHGNMQQYILTGRATTRTCSLPVRRHVDGSAIADSVLLFPQAGDRLGQIIRVRRGRFNDVRTLFWV